MLACLLACSERMKIEKPGVGRPLLGPAKKKITLLVNYISLLQGLSTLEAPKQLITDRYQAKDLIPFQFNLEQFMIRLPGSGQFKRRLVKKQDEVKRLEHVQGQPQPQPQPQPQEAEQSQSQSRVVVKRNPGCIRQCLRAGTLHPSQCHFLC